MMGADCEVVRGEGRAVGVMTGEEEELEGEGRKGGEEDALLEWIAQEMQCWILW